MKNTIRKIATYGILMAGTLAGITGCSDDSPKLGAELASAVSNISSKNEVSNANQELRDFPESIPGAEGIKKYETSDAKYCLVHIRQRHFVTMPFENDIKNPELGNMYGQIVENFYSSISNNQENIYRILNHLKGKKNLESIFAEGIGRKLSLGELKEEFEMRNKLMGAAGLYDHSDPRRFLFSAGAEIIMGMYGKLAILPAENSDLNNMAFEAKKVSDYNDPREDYAIGQVAKNPQSPFSVLMYGGSHDFRDNLQRWNNEHPNEKFSLIEITPKGYSQNKISREGKAD